MEQAHQQVGRLDGRADQLQRIDRIQQHVRAAPVLALVLGQHVLGRQQTILARAALIVHQRRSLGHVLQHHATGAPVLALAGQSAATVGQGKAGGQLFGLGEIGLGAGRQRPARQRRDALVGLRAFALVDQDREISLADLVEGRDRVVQRVLVIGRIGADARGLAVLGRAIIIRRQQTHRTARPAHLQGQLPAQLHRLADQRGQQAHLGHQPLDRRGVVMLLEHILEHAVEPRDAAPDVGGVKLERQDGIVPGNTGAEGHGLS